MSGSGKSGRRSRFGWLAALAGLLGASANAVAAGAVVSEAAPKGDKQSAVPAGWQAFATRLQREFQVRLAEENDAIRLFHDEMVKRAGHADVSTETLAISTWILPSGKIERIEFGQLDPAVAMRLRQILLSVDAGPPPPDMLQPLRMRFSLRPKDQPE